MNLMYLRGTTNSLEIGGLSLVTWRRRRGVEYSNTRVRVVTYYNCTMYESTRIAQNIRTLRLIS